MNYNFKTTALVFCVGFWLQPYTVLAQDSRKHLSLLGVPSATIAPAGRGFVALSYANERLRTPDDTDASLSFGHGFGDAVNGIGFQLDAQVTSLSDNFGDSGYLTASLSRRISTSPRVYVGASIERLLPWGDSRDLDPAVNLMATGFTTLPLGDGNGTPLMWTLGAGTDVRDRYSEAGFFGGVGIGLSPSLATSVSYYGDHVILGLSLQPAENLYLSASLIDAFDEQQDRRVTISAVWVFDTGLGR
ncbi:MAG: hypothetical protein ABJ327_21690 [Litoreibacter sp.]